VLNGAVIASLYLQLFNAFDTGDHAPLLSVYVRNMIGERG
jgi:hypothetical protein